MLFFRRKNEFNVLLTFLRTLRNVSKSTLITLKSNIEEKTICRIKSLIVVFVCFFAACASADPVSVKKDEHSESTGKISRQLHLINIDKQNKIKDEAHNEFQRDEKQFNTLMREENIEHSRQVLRVLQQHFEPSANDPDYIHKDLEVLAKYIARYTNARKLVLSIQHKEWRLKYEPETFRTNVIGTRLNIESVTIFFDPRSAAKLKFHKACSKKVRHCVASPADALLHEFLHAQKVLLTPNEFLAEGGMGGFMYPYAHEMAIIRKENQLYRSMSRIDDKPRPIRSEHSGRHVVAACATCLN